jgi:ATP-dependent DNA helicase RecQ
VARGENGPVPTPPCPSYSADVRARYQALRDWRRRVALARGVDPDVILPNAVLQTLAERNPQTPRDLEEVDGLGPWARETWGPEILQALRGCSTQ